ncbi:hypothetical protein BRADI_4g35873v3 [Brachypodium distachyon]|uniref:Uncharacterized protein n=1 Tax=Brachypodium distachyon TaxID=15368 RepID=A0A2K2CSL7_BRADI|nr:hypothetical protein BRADI_4g35873v3 [Brachypodium distachyon]
MLPNLKLFISRTNPSLGHHRKNDAREQHLSSSNMARFDLRVPHILGHVLSVLRLDVYGSTMLTRIRTTAMKWNNMFDF